MAMCVDCNTGVVIPLVETLEEATARVSKGSEFVTTGTGGTEWADRINLDEFDVQSGSDCVGAQLYGGDWFNFRHAFPDTNYDELVLMGFDSPRVDRGELDLLNEAWRTEIARLRKLNAA